MGAQDTAGPDQAGGWVVALACFGINVIMAGISQAAGVLYVALIEIYGVSREAAMSPFSLRVCVRSMISPLIGILGLKYGIRAVTTAGGVVAAVGCIACYFAPDIVWITAFWGVVHGLGFGMSTVIHMMIIGEYFDKYKASALGLGYTGDCFGSFVFPSLIEYLLTTYGLKGTFLLLGGVVLNTLPLALLLKKPSWMRKGKYPKNTAKQINGMSAEESIKNTQLTQSYSNAAFNSSDEEMQLAKNALNKNSMNNTALNLADDAPKYPNAVKECQMIRMAFQQSLLQQHGDTGSLQMHKKTSEVGDLQGEIVEHYGSSSFVLEKKSNTKEVNKETNECVEFENVPNLEERRTSSFMRQISQEIAKRLRSGSYASQCAQDGFIGCCQSNQNDETEGEENNWNNALTFSTSNDVQSTLYIRGTHLNSELVTTDNELQISNGIKRTTSSRTVHSKDSKTPSAWRTLLRANIKPIFILICVTMGTYAFLFVAVITVIIDYAVDQGVSHERGKFLIIAFSIADLFGRLIFGQVIDRKLVQLKNYAGTAMLLMGIMVCVIPLNTSFNYMLVTMCLYGFVQSAIAIMFPILIHKYMEKKEEPVAMGCSNFYGGVLMFFMGPTIGYFRDNIGSYDGVFYISGGIVAVVGLVWQAEPLLLKFQRKGIQQPPVHERTVTKL